MGVVMTSSGGERKTERPGLPDRSMDRCPKVLPGDGKFVDSVGE